MNYPNYYQQPMFNPQVPQMPQMDAPRPAPAINWVSGEVGAKSWVVGRGESVLLMDSENPIFYIKSTDQSGMPQPMRVFDYTERAGEQNHPPIAINNDDYVTRKEYEELKAMIEGMKKTTKEKTV